MHLTGALVDSAVQDWLQARVTELDANCAAQVRNLRAKDAQEKMTEYLKMDAEDQAAVDAAFESHAAKVEAALSTPVGEVEPLEP